MIDYGARFSYNVDGLRLEVEESSRERAVTRRVIKFFFFFLGV